MSSTRFLLILASAILVLASSRTAAHDHDWPVALNADFNDKAPDQPIGTGGAELGEPVQITSSLDAIVRPRADDDDDLELALDAGPGTNSTFVRFEFLDSRELRDGVVLIQAELETASAEQPTTVTIAIREQANSAHVFANLFFLGTGILRLDGSGYEPIVVPGFVVPGERYQVWFEFDLSTRRLQVIINDELITPEDGVEHDITDRGIGAVLFSLPGSQNPRSARIDNIHVSWLREDDIFEDGFEIRTD